ACAALNLKTLMVASLPLTDCHIHIQPLRLFNPGARKLMEARRPNWHQIVEFCESPKAFLEHLDQAGVERAVLINYVAPEVIGFSREVIPGSANYSRPPPQRLLPCGSLHPRHPNNSGRDRDELVRLGTRLIKTHPPHQLLFPNAYLNGV